MKSHTRVGRRRGAAMVEGIVVMSAMLGFLGLISGVEHAYATKLQTQQRTRSSTLYTASHACDTGNSEGGGSIMGAPGGNGTPAGNAGSNSASWNVAKSEWKGSSPLLYIADANATGGKGPIALQKRGQDLQVASLSRCVCNEPDYKHTFLGQFGAFFKFGLKMFTNLGGAAALFSIPGG